MRHFSDAPIAVQARNVINNLGARANRNFCYLGLSRIDGNRNLQHPAHAFQDRQNARQFCVSRRARRARPRRFPTDVEQICSSPLHFQSVFDRALRIQELAAVGKTIGRNVEHAHYERTLAQCERARGKAQLEFAAFDHQLT